MSDVLRVGKTAASLEMRWVLTMAGRWARCWAAMSDNLRAAKMAGRLVPMLACQKGSSSAATLGASRVAHWAAK